jgi:hypothetical protein
VLHTTQILDGMHVQTAAPSTAGTASGHSQSQVLITSTLHATAYHVPHYTQCIVNCNWNYLHPNGLMSELMNTVPD